MARGVIPAREVTQASPRRDRIMLKLFKTLLRDDDGPTAVEYAVMLALIVAACLGAVNAMANATANSFNESAAELGGVLG